MAGGVRLYQHVGALMVRATTHPGVGVPAVDVDLSGPGASGRAGGWLAAVWGHEQFRHALQAASLALAARIVAALAAAGPAAEPGVKELRRLVHSTASYLLRWQGRATPFGHFAGVAPVRTGPVPQADWGSEHRMVPRPDAVWLGAVADRLAADPGTRERLPVAAHPAAVSRGGRIVAPGRTPAQGPAPLEVSIAATGPVRAALAAASTPTPFPAVAEAVSAAFPRAGSDSVHRLLDRLLGHGVLLSALDEVATTHDPLDLLHTVTDSAAAPGPLPHFTGEVTGSTPSTWPDTALDARVVLPDSVLSEAESAASVLVRLSPYPHGVPGWREYHRRFRRTYGVDAAVSVTELVGDAGLGWPSGFLGAGRPARPRTLSARDEAFLSLAQQAALDGAHEVVLSERTVASLAVVDAAELTPPPCVEMAFQLHADSAEAVRLGRFDLWLSAAARPSSSMAGRFVDLLPEGDTERWAAALAGPPGPLPAQLMFSPRRRRSGNVTRTPQLTSHAIALGWPGAGHGSIPLADLAVRCDARHLFLIRSSTGELVEPRVLHALEPTVLTPPLARFLAEVAGARRTAWRLPDWGAASRLPYLPRLRHGRTVLAPARWLLAADQLPGPAADRAAWEEAFAHWRTRQRLPARVVLMEAEMGLPLDLDVLLHRELLRARLAKVREVHVREAPSPVAGSGSPSTSGFMGRAHEFLTVLHAAVPAAAGPAGPAVPAAPPELPGVSRLVCARLHGHPDRQNEILTEHLPRLLAGWTPAPLWWFARRGGHRDHHLSLVLRPADPAGYRETAERLGDWADELHRLGLVPRLDLATHRHQSGRYGHGPARDAAERVFAADTAAAVAQIAYAARTRIPAEALTAASLVDLAAAYAPTPGDGWAWMTAHLPRGSGSVGTGLHRQTQVLAEPGAAWLQEPDVQDLADAWTARAEVLADYRRALEAVQREPMAVFRSLLHLHHVRSLGGGPVSEATTHRLARTVALGRIHRRKARP
ncbi:lantibiotic dehydratase [Streptomyces lavendulae]|uniref:lantibiotic dehydratase n=1 Tax=Streptomyces lavendulae TaxID=1914 RepID=UPI0036F0D0A9